MKVPKNISIFALQLADFVYGYARIPVCSPGVRLLRASAWVLRFPENEKRLRDFALNRSDYFQDGMDGDNCLQKFSTDLRFI